MWVRHTRCAEHELERIAIIGLGLIGGSLGLALKKAAASDLEIVGFSQSAQTRAAAEERGAIDCVASDLVAAVRAADVVVIATPVMTVRSVLERIASHVPRGCVVTDTGSTKRKVMGWAGKYLASGVSFVGGHPMAGKETSGIGEADAGLFKGCVYCLTPGPTSTPEAVQRLERLVTAIGARPFLIDAALHDELVAGVSHLPMLLSAAFVSATAGSPSWSEMAKLAAGGYRDMSRLASGNLEMNRDICVTNREAIIRWIDCYIDELTRYRRLLEGDGEGLADALARAREARQRWLEGIR